MSQSWTTGIDRVAMATLERGIRTLAVVAPHRCAGVSAIAARLAEASQFSGRSTLLISLGDVATKAAAPSSRNRPDALAFEVAPAACGYHHTTVSLDAPARAVLSSTARLRALLDERCTAYEAVILDLPPLVASSPLTINAAAAAASCDGVLLVALTSRTRGADLNTARSLLDLGGAKLAGVIMNDLAAPTLGAEIAREMARIERFAPRVARWGARKALASPILNRV